MTDQIYFWSDLHFGHKRLVTHFRDIEALGLPPLRGTNEQGEPVVAPDELDAYDKRIIELWNARVGPGDRGYILGDVSFRSTAQTIGLLAGLHGQKYIVWGNHDHPTQQAVKRVPSLIAKAYDYKEIRIPYVDSARPKDVDKRIVMLHYPIASWHGIGKGSWHLHGHCHGNLADDPNLARLDVGVDRFPDGPVSFDEVAEILGKRRSIAPDHHDGNGNDL